MFTNPIEANKFENSFVSKYKDKVDVTKPKELTPRFKIVNIPCAELTEDFTDLIYECNNWIEKGALSKIKEYSSFKPYKNIIFECFVNTLSLVLKRGVIRVGLEEFSCHPDIDLLQCFHCCQYGHLANGCSNKAACKRCAGEHHYKECSEENAKKCILCTSNQLILDRKIRRGHAATSGSCPIRIDRLNSVIAAIMKT